MILGIWSILKHELSPAVREATVSMYAGTARILHQGGGTGYFVQQEWAQKHWLLSSSKG